MKKFKILTKPTRIQDLNEDDLIERNVSSDWEVKAQRLQARRWRKLKQQLV